MASQVVIENPVINSPYEEPTRHFKFTNDGITNGVGSLFDTSLRMFRAKSAVMREMSNAGRC